jgi:hypothetical protein
MANDIRVGTTVFDVHAYGAIGNGVADDTPAIQAAINAAQNAGGGVVLFRNHTYIIQPQSGTATFALSITGSRITLRGQGRNQTHLLFKVWPLLNPATNWQVIAGSPSTVLRGHGIFFAGGTSGAHQHDITIEDLELDGGAGYTGDVIWPANVTTGDGWDLTNKGILCGINNYVDDVIIQRCFVHSWRGEVIYCSGPFITRVHVLDCEVSDTNADCLSMDCEATIVGNNLHTAAFSGIESGYQWKYIVSGNKIHDIDNNGIAMVSYQYAEPVGPVFIHDNIIERCKATGVELVNVHNGYVTNNYLCDCGYVANNRAAFFIDSNDNQVVGANTKNVHITNNQIVIDQNSTGGGFIVSADNAQVIDGLEIVGNSIWLTPNAVANGITANGVIGISATINNFRFKHNYARGTTFNFTNQMVASDVLLTTTAATVIAKYRPSVQANFTVYVFYRVITASTVVTITVTYFDGAGTAQTLTLVNGTQPVGNYILPVSLVNAVGSDEGKYIKVNATAGTANQVFVSSSIMEAQA